MPVREKGRRSHGSRLHVPSHVPSRPQTVAKVRGFSPTASGFTAETDWLLEGTGFEPSVPPDRSSGGIYPADVRSDAPTLFSSGARRRLRATRIRSASIAGTGYLVRELSLFPSRSPKETRIHKWDQEFESVFLQRRVCCEPVAEVGCR
jgi:hypothetical protein